MKMSKKQLRLIIREECRKLIAENSSRISKLVPLITSDKFSSVMSGITLARAVDLAKILEYESPKQTLVRKTYSTYKIFHKIILAVDEKLMQALQEVKYFPTITKPNDEIIFEYNRPEPGCLTIRYVEEGTEMKRALD